MEVEEEEVHCGVREWIEQKWRDLDARDYGKFMAGCWALWEHRNKVAFEGVAVDPDRVVRRANDVLNEGEGCGAVGGGRKVGRASGEKNEGWRPAPEGSMNLNGDAGVKEVEGVGTRVVCRDSHDTVLWGLSIVWEVEWEPWVVEVVAVLLLLQEAAARGVRVVIVESDCLQVIDAFKERRSGRSVLAQVLDDILIICNSFQSVTWSYTSRVNNSVAHALSHAIPRISSRLVWSNDLPPLANSAALFDLSLLK
ncbi:uncharacterized protein LOC141587588 [Silene latifolia]|uniref:uncharacterized protein LOC141587588 n=1 Tax=Silene latifolia TaxID=37657 RepID=UPI003D76EC73